MKKCLIILLLLSFTTITANSAALDTNSWYQYNGSSTLYTFSVKFPTDWNVFVISDDTQGFAPENSEEEYSFTMREFEGYTYDQALSTVINSSIALSKIKDIVFPTSKEDLIAKEVTYYDGSDETEFPVYFIKRGSLIVALRGDMQNYPDISEAMVNSFKFTDNWHQYIDFGDNYAFIFPSNYQINNTDSGVEILDQNAIFTVAKYENTSIDDAANAAEGSHEDLLSQEEIIFHGIEKAIRAKYKDTQANKKFSRILVEKDGDSFALTDVNITGNFPHSDYYDDYVVEMLESFEFFNIEIEGDYYSFETFPDVRDDHPNAAAINALVEQKVINGYPDGTFKPDGEINRAELTKMIVATKLIPDVEEYNNCFPDVKKEWFAGYICYAKEQGWVEGYPNGKFKPETNVNRVEALKIILEVIFNGVPSKDPLRDESVADVDTKDWYGKYFIFADNKKLLDKQHIVQEEDQYFYLPDQNMTRKEVAETIYRANQLK